MKFKEKRGLSMGMALIRPEVSPEKARVRHVDVPGMCR
jgi:hypothetical protein